jgi:hypothetical protein
VYGAITNDATFRRRLVDAVNIDRLNLGPVPTIRLNWLQPHEATSSFLFRARRSNGVARFINGMRILSFTGGAGAICGSCLRDARS